MDAPKVAIVALVSGEKSFRMVDAHTDLKAKNLRQILEEISAELSHAIDLAESAGHPELAKKLKSARDYADKQLKYVKSR